MIAAPGGGSGSSGTCPQCKHLEVSTDLGITWTQLSGKVQDWGVYGGHSANLQLIASARYLAPVYTTDSGGTWKQGKRARARAACRPAATPRSR